MEAEIKEPSGKKLKFKELEVVKKTLNKQLSTENSLIRLGDKVGVPIPSISFELPSLDKDVIQTGGAPRGRIIEIFGPESSGKTTLALHLIGCEQRNEPDNICAFIDAEHALDPTYATKLGVNVDDLLVSQPDCGEDALETIEALVDSKLVGLIVVDSVSALVPRAELEGDMGDANIGLQARLMSQAMRKLVGKVSKNNVTVIFINQIREKIGVMFGSPETTTGGRALKFFSSLRLDVRRREVIGAKESPDGHVLEIKAVKNKVGTPLKSCKIHLLYESGFDRMRDTVEYAEKAGVLTKEGKWYKMDGKSIGDGLDNTVFNLLEDKKLLDKIKEKIK